MRKSELKHRLEVMTEARDYWMGEATTARTQTKILADLLMSEWVFVHESKVNKVDMLLKPHLGDGQ